MCVCPCVFMHLCVCERGKNISVSKYFPAWLVRDNANVLEVIGLVVAFKSILSLVTFLFYCYFDSHHSAPPPHCPKESEKPTLEIVLHSVPRRIPIFYSTGWFLDNIRKNKCMDDSGLLIFQRHLCQFSLYPPPSRSPVIHHPL